MHNQIFLIPMFGGVEINQKGIETKVQEVRGFEQCNYPLWKNYALGFFLGGGGAKWVKFGPTKRALYIRQA